MSSLETLVLRCWRTGLRPVLVSCLWHFLQAAAMTGPFHDWEGAAKTLLES